MRTLFVTIMILCSIAVSAQHKYVYVTESGDYKVYVNTNIKEVNNLCYVWEKWMLINDSTKEKGFINNGERDYSKYSYSVIRSVYDFSKERNKPLGIIDYNCDGDIINEISYENGGWIFLVPESTGYTVMNKVKLLKMKR